jgi:hypothetical protein
MFFYGFSSFPFLDEDRVKAAIKGKPQSAPAAVFLPESTPRKKLNRSFKSLVVLNGDSTGDDRSDPFVYPKVEGMPTISFECLRRLMENGGKTEKITVLNVAHGLASGSLAIRDYTLDEIRKPTPEERKQLKKGLAVKPPVGFSCVMHANGRWEWHRSATVLIEDRANEQFYLIGQDEGTYFGVVMPYEFSIHPATVASAYKSLIPAAVRGKKYQRQGEWFMVPVQTKAVPDLKDCVATGQMIDLPVEHDDSHTHAITSGDIRVSRSGQVYAYEPSLRHIEHGEIDGMDGWYTFYRNTAVRSVSVEGVD